MAIQHRRGIYDRFDPTRLLPGEWAIVLSGDPGARDGMAAYVCFAAGKVKRIATFEDMVENIANANPEVVARLTEGVRGVEEAIGAAEELRAAAERGRASAEQGRASAESSRVAAERSRASAESSRAAAESGRVTAETQRMARFAELEQLANGWVIHHCAASEYDASTRVPTVADPDPGTLYCVPNEDAASDDGWVEWRYDSESGGFEHVGSTHAEIDPVTTAQIDSIAAGTAVTGSKVLNATGLTYLWAKLKAAFSAIGHKHAASDVTSGTLGVARGGTGQTTAAGERNRLGLGNTTGAVPVANGGTGADSAEAARANLGITPANVVDGQAIAPASVTATGAIQGSSVGDGGGTLAELRESVSPHYVTASAGEIAAGGSNYNVQSAAIEVPAGKSVVVLGCWTGAGCIAGNGGYSAPTRNFAASVYNPTAVKRTPTVVWGYLLA